MSSDLLTLAHYLSGEFENRAQATADPVWYVPLRLWQRPIQIFPADITQPTATLFAEQANTINLDKPYRQRLIHLQRSPSQPAVLMVQYYGFKDPGKFRGAGQQPELLSSLTPDQVECLPGCVLEVEQQTLPTGLRFLATAPSNACCQFQYDGKIGQVALGFEVSDQEYLTYDKGIDPQTGQALWGALMGPYRYQKTQQFDVF